MMDVPYIPETAPFTPEQRAYLNGFFAALFSRAPVSNVAAAPLSPLTILFGSQTGNAENLAKRAAKQAVGFAATVYDMAQYPRENLKSEKNLLIITSTYGDGDPPDNAKGLWEFLSSSAAPSLKGVRYSVLALGDSNYAKFCECGKSFDRRLQELGASRVYERVDCDVEYEAGFVGWVEGALKGLQTPSSPKSTNGRTNPHPAPLLTNRRLNGPSSSKDTRHFELNLEGSTLEYEVGDALGVFPANCPDLVEELLRVLACPKDDSLRDALLKSYEINKIPLPLLKAVAERTKDSLLAKFTAPGVNGELTEFLWGRDVVDLLTSYPTAKFAPDEFLGFLKKLQPRLYSISSSPKAHPGQVHLTVSVVRYSSLNRARKGVCSTFLAERATGHAPVFVHKAKHFRLPRDPNTPMIMVGPGTGIAPFRAFLEERRAIGAQGKSWLFFGDQHADCDFLYGNELETMLKEGTLTRLDAAFSRDQSDKIYVQHRMLEHAKEIFAWLEEGAHFYVCGDAARMAKDVDQALHTLLERNGAHAADYVEALKKAHRYQRDVY
jgi:sulfite reductase (NADPH) flavoprotein alpha-component